MSSRHRRGRTGRLDRVGHQRVGRAAGEAAVPERPAGRPAWRAGAAVGRSSMSVERRPGPRGGRRVADRAVDRGRRRTAACRRRRPCRAGRRAPLRSRADATTWAQPGRGAQHDEVARARDLGHPLPQHPAQLVDRGDAVGLELGHGVHGVPARHAHLDRRRGRRGRATRSPASRRCPRPPSSSTQLRLVGHRVLRRSAGRSPGLPLASLGSARSGRTRSDAHGTARTQGRGRRAGGCGPAGTRPLVGRRSRRPSPRGRGRPAGSA